jgi:hypothetical protein
VSLRAVPARLFSIVCDTCGVETAGSTMPVAAELRAAEGGWRTGRNPLTHTCPWCIAKAPATKTAAPPEQLAARKEARINPTVPAIGH